MQLSCVRQMPELINSLGSAVSAVARAASLLTLCLLIGASFSTLVFGGHLHNRCSRIDLASSPPSRSSASRVPHAPSASSVSALDWVSLWGRLLEDGATPSSERGATGWLDMEVGEPQYCQLASGVKEESGRRQMSKSTKGRWQTPTSRPPAPPTPTPSTERMESWSLQTGGRHLGRTEGRWQTLVEWQPWPPGAPSPPLRSLTPPTPWPRREPAREMCREVSGCVYGYLRAPVHCSCSPTLGTYICGTYMCGRHRCIRGISTPSAGMEVLYAAH